MGNRNITQPDYGRRLIPCLIDEVASCTPHKIYCYLPLTTRTDDGFRAVTYQTFSNAINACAWWIEKEVGKGKDFATLAYLGPSDLRNIILIIAAVKTGHKALFASPRNNLKAHLNLLENTHCHVLMTTEPILPIGKELLMRRSMRHFVIPEVEEWLESPLVPAYPFLRTFEQARYEPFVVVHTSGSTGYPKAVIVNHGTMAASDAFNGLMTDDEAIPMALDEIRDKKSFISLPLFHIAGIDFMLSKAICHGIVPVLPPQGPVTAELVDMIHKGKLVEVSVVVPSIVQGLVASPWSLQNLRRVTAIVTLGGPLSQGAGDAVVERTKLYNIMGSSETSNVPTEMVDREDWDYFKFSPKSGYHMRHYCDNLCELGFVRKPHLSRFQAVFSTFPHLQEYFTGDLYIKHPEKPDLWKYSGRADDIIVLSNGEKINPVNMENLIGAHPNVRSVLIVGQARFQTALLAEARVLFHNDSKEIFIDDLWLTVQKFNAQCDNHARISKDLILVASPDKPFLRAGKGTVQRKMTESLYEKEINKLYDDFERAPAHSKLGSTYNGPPDSYNQLTGTVPLSPTTIEGWLRGAICEVTGWNDLNVDDNFFTLGMDSLQVINLVRAINAAKKETGMQNVTISSKAVYKHPTLRNLAKAWMSNQELPESAQLKEKSGISTGILEIKNLVSRYSWNLPISCRPTLPSKATDSMYVLLTGSTGSLGPYLLDTLLANPNVAHIYCLNRSADGKKRQIRWNRTHGFQTGWSLDRVSFLQNDLSQEYFGVGAKVYRALLAKVNHVLHNAWEVNFNLPLSSFEFPHLIGVRQLIDFSARSASRASITFLSSISSSMSWHLNNEGPVPERIIDDPSAPTRIGYAQSKYVAEQILASAAEIAEVPVTICRVGQVAGSVGLRGDGGCWNKKEWLPSLVASSKYLHKIPASLGLNDMVDWIPVDVLSQVLVELMGFSHIDSSNDVHTYGQNGSAKSHPMNITENDYQSTLGATTGSDTTRLDSRPRSSDLGNHNAVRCSSTDFTDQTMDARNSSSKGSADKGNSIQIQSPKSRANEARVFHAVNPHHTTWSNLLPAVQKSFSGISVEAVPLADWVDALRESAARTENIDINPAIRLLDFYKSLLSDSGHGNLGFETTDTVRESKELARLEAVKPEWMELWMEQWNF